MNKEFLQKLLEVPSPSGCEELGVGVWREEMERLGLQLFYNDKAGNTGYKIGEGEMVILLSGHLDEICMAVRGITENGYIIPSNMAGIDKKVLPGSTVLILSEPNLTSITGTIQKNPIHIEASDEKLKAKVLDLEELRIDIGAESKGEIEEMGIHVGSSIVLGRSISLGLGQHRLYGNSLDDKAGVFVVSEIMSRLSEYSRDSDWRKKYTVIGLACIGEESGLLGARKVAGNINPDISIDLDVTHASDPGQYDTKKYGEVKLGKGPVIEWGQDKSRRLGKIFKTIQVKTQDGVSRIGGTNTKEFFLGCKDAETMLISLPLTSMHTQTETMDWRDIEGAIDLITNSIIECLL